MIQGNPKARSPALVGRSIESNSYSSILDLEDLARVNHPHGSGMESFNCGSNLHIEIQPFDISFSQDPQ
jgi:hypothetical protein